LRTDLLVATDLAFATEDCFDLEYGEAAMGYKY
jgi:hypothetical protein